MDGFGRFPAGDVAAPTQERFFVGNGLRTQHPTIGTDLAGHPSAERWGPDAAGGVTNVVYDSADAGDWQVHLASATRALESEVQRTPETAREVAQHAQLRLLHLLAGRRDRGGLMVSRDSVREFAYQRGLPAFWKMLC